MAAAAAARATADVVIVGAGVIGSSAALALARAGRSVVVVDRNPGAGLGSTSYSSGICRTHYAVRDSAQFAWEGYQYWLQWRDHLGVNDPRGYASLRETGGLMLSQRASRGFIAKVAAHFDEFGIPYEMLDRAELEKRFGPSSPVRMSLDAMGPPRRLGDPLFGTPCEDDVVDGAFYMPRCGYVSDPKLAVDNLRLAADATGKARFAFGQPITSLRLVGGRVAGVTLADGSSIAAPVVLNAAGPLSSAVTAMAFAAEGAPPNDMRVTTRAMRQEVAYVKAPPGVDYEANGPVVTDLDTGVYFRPEIGNRILIGSVEPECDELEWIDNADDASPSLTDVHTAHIMRLALRFPTLEITGASGTQGIVACYDVTPDWTPIYDRTSIPGVYLAVGTSGNQFKNAGVAGTLVAALIDRCESGVNQDEDPLRFELTKSGTGALDTSKFSRLREPSGGANVLG